MPLLYSVVARGPTVLAKHAACTGNFAEVTEQILAKIPPHDDKLTYSQGPYLFHYICESRIIYMCITDDDFQRSRAFLYLNEIKRRFQAAYGQGAQSALAYAMNSEFSRVLANEMVIIVVRSIEGRIGTKSETTIFLSSLENILKSLTIDLIECLNKHYSESKDIDTLSKVHGELDELKDIMVKNIDNVAARGERLELLINKTENLTASSVTFRKTSRNLARSLFWKNIKLYVIVAIILIVVIYFVVSMACGGLAWKNCVGN